MEASFVFRAFYSAMRSPLPQIVDQVLTVQEQFEQVMFVCEVFVGFPPNFQYCNN